MLYLDAHIALYEHDCMQAIRGLSWLILTSPANKQFPFYYKNIPRLFLFLPCIEYSFAKSFSLSFPLPSFCLTSCGVSCFPSPPPLVCEQLIEFIFPISTHHLSLLTSVQFSAGEAVVSISFILVDKW